MEILKYQQKNEEDLFEAIGKDPDWTFLTNSKNGLNYKKALQSSATYVCYKNSEFYGYIRAINDNGLGIYISELYVVPHRRNKKIGQLLIERIKKDYINLMVYALSDEDEYYIKKGYKKIGSVFEI